VIVVMRNALGSDTGWRRGRRDRAGAGGAARSWRPDSSSRSRSI